MERIIDTQLDELKTLILVMGGQVEKALSEAMAALATRNPQRFTNVHTIEKKINEDHLRVDQACIHILARQGPVAGDLRLILAIIKINTDLERMGDQATNIAYTGRDYLSRPTNASVEPVTRMAELVKVMVKESLDSFVRGDLVLAKKILMNDDEVDELKNQIFKDMIAHIKTHPDEVEASLDVILIARNLERLGDHATNIAEDVIFAFSGQDVRHGGNFGQPNG